MDLVAPLSHSSNLLDLLAEHVPSPFRVDKPLRLGHLECLVARDQGDAEFQTMSKLYPNSFLSYDPSLFDIVASCDHREALAVLRDRLLEILQVEDIPSPMPKVRGT
jgi:hypothetical protein